MMRLKLPPLAALGLLMATATAIHAAPADITRKPDVTLALCDDGRSTCITRLVGDLNGDRIDDLLVEKMTAAEFLAGMVDANQPRRFEVVLGPFTPDASGRWQNRPAATFHLRSDQLRAPVAMADVNGDGFNDLAFGASELKGVYEAQRIAVVFGSKTWTGSDLSYDLGRAERGSLVIERKKQIQGENAPFSPNSSVTPAFADLNADGHLDILLGMDPVAASKLDEARIHATAAASEIAVMFGGGAMAGKVNFRDDLVLRELGACGQGLAGVADVSGDGVPDILARRCMGDGLPDQLRVTAGGSDLARTVALQNLTSPVRLPALDKIVRGQMQVPGQPAQYATDGVDGGDDPNVPPPSDPGRGYLPAGEPPTPFFPSPLFVEDVNDDGVRDIVLGFGDNTHIWLGGADIAARVAELRTDRVYVHAGYGRLVATQSWKPIDLNGDGKRDLMLTGNASDATSSRCPANARCAPAPGMPGTGGADVKGGLGSMRFYQRDWAEVDVLDVEQDEPQASWNSESLAPWGMGDFNGDGVTDLLLDAATPGISATADMVKGGSLSIAFGPFN